MSMENIRCVIHRGAFSGERGVQIKMGNETVYDGALPLSYLKTEDGGEITETIPAKDRPVAGQVRALVMMVGGAEALRLPDGTTLRIGSEELSKIRV